MDVSETHVTAAETVRKSFVIEPEQVQDRRVKVVHADLILDGTISKLVRRTVDEPALHPSASEENTETERAVVAPVGSLGKGSPPEFG